MVAVEESATGERLFITEGDANQLADDPVRASHVLGRGTLVLPYLGYLLVGSTTSAFVTLVLAVPLSHYALSTTLKALRR